jgi:hypothetical protein
MRLWPGRVDVAQLICAPPSALQDYCGSLSEEAIRKNFVLIYELLDEVGSGVIWSDLEQRNGNPLDTGPRTTCALLVWRQARPNSQKHGYFDTLDLESVFGVPTAF